MFAHNVDPRTWLTLHHDRVAAGAARAEAEANANVVQRRALVRRRPLTDILHLPSPTVRRECGADTICAA